MVRAGMTEKADASFSLPSDPATNPKDRQNALGALHWQGHECIVSYLDGRGRPVLDLDLSRHGWCALLDRGLSADDVLQLLWLLRMVWPFWYVSRAGRWVSIVSDERRTLVDDAAFRFRPPPNRRQPAPLDLTR